jgi:hypothetical protein
MANRNEGEGAARQGKEVRMWKSLGFGRNECAQAANWLEEAAALLPEASTADGLPTQLVPGDATHVRECAACQTALKVFLESRALLANLKDPERKSNPFFAKRVMAVIAAREAELERSTRAWAAVPRLAARLAGVAMLVLLIAGTWAYKTPARKHTNQPVVAESSGQLIEDNSSVPVDRDEVLISLLERGK